MLKDKGLIIGIVLTIILIASGVFLMTKGNGSSLQNSTAISSEILAPKNGYSTSGISNGQYLPATSSAKITIVEFSDYECPACSLYNPLIKQLLTEFAGQINFVARNYPLTQHSNALISSYAAESAGMQGKFWQMHDKLYETQNSWSNSSDAKSIFIGYAQEMGLDIDKFKTDIDSSIVKDIVKKDTDDGNLVKLTETPTFYLDGIKIANLPGDYSGLKKIVSAAISNK